VSIPNRLARPGGWHSPARRSASRASIGRPTYPGEAVPAAATSLSSSPAPSRAPRPARTRLPAAQPAGSAAATVVPRTLITAAHRGAPAEHLTACLRNDIARRRPTRLRQPLRSARPSRPCSRIVPGLGEATHASALCPHPWPASRLSARIWGNRNLASAVCCMPRRRHVSGEMEIQPRRARHTSKASRID
jgi:hypothetical protein